MTDVDLVRRWTAALRGGEYRQGIGGLHASEQFCCLGVVTDLAVAAGDLPGWEAGPFAEYGVRGPDGVVETSYLPTVLGIRLGLRGSGAKLDGTCWQIGGKRYTSLVDANDQGVEFAAIAAAVDAWADDIAAREAACPTS